MDIFKKVLGLVLSSGNDQKRIVLSLDPEWFDTKFLRDIYEAIFDISMNNDHADILNVVQWLREHDRLEKTYMVEISGLPTAVSMSDLMNTNGILNEAFYQYSVRKISLVVQNINHELLQQDPSSNKILEELKKGTEALTNDKNVEIEENADIIDLVLDKHEKAK